jgi:hypothetical protein
MFVWIIVGAVVAFAVLLIFLNAKLNEVISALREGLPASIGQTVYTATREQTRELKEQLQELGKQLNDIIYASTLEQTRELEKQLQELRRRQ